MSIKFSTTHEWVDSKDADLVVIGITDFAQDQLGDLVYIKLPKVGGNCSKGESISVIESVKSAADLIAPVSGVVVEVNNSLVDEPELVTEDPMGDGWFIKVKPSNVIELDELMDESGYDNFIKE